MAESEISTLHYFDGYGRGEPIRMLLFSAKVEYEDHRIKIEEWNEELKSRYPNG